MKNDETWDIVVVGGGGAGLAAAVTAVSPDCRVLLLEKCPVLGGSTAMAIGSITGSGTRLQSHAGVQDSKEDFFNDLDAAVNNLGLKDRDNIELRKVLVRDAGSAIDWITDLGASFVGPFTEQGIHRIPRMHNIVPNSKSYIAVMRQVAVKKGVEIRTSSRVLELITSNGIVTGVRASTLNRVSTIRVKRAVILATGDYTSSRKLKAEYLSEELAQVDGVNPDNTGDGHLMAMKIGAGVRNMDLPKGMGIRFVSPNKPLWVESLPTFPSLSRLMGAVARHVPKSFFRFIAKRFLTVHTAPSIDIFRKGAILVNKEGKRFTNEWEKSVLTTGVIDIAKQPEKIAYIFLDASLARTFSNPPNYISTAPGIAYAYFDDYRVLRRDLVHTGHTVPKLAERVGIDPVTLAETINKYNVYATSQKDDDFGRKELGQGFHEGPFYMLGPLQGYFYSTEGSLTVDSECRVLTKEGEIIPKLYAAGSVGQGGMMLAGHGVHIGWALVSGRIAGRNAREEAKTEA